MMGDLLGTALCLAAGAALSVVMGQDANWDLLNYHLYNGYTFLQGGFTADLLPTGLQSYLNPLLDALYAGLALGPLRDAPRILAAVTGLWYGVALVLTARLATLLYADRILAAAAFAMAVTGAAMISQVGTVTGEVQAAVVMMAGLLIMLKGSALPRTAWGGLLFGVAAGLKLTAAAFAPAALLAAISLSRAPRTMRRWIGAGLLFSGAWIGGLALADGWWGSMLARRFGNPVFPLFNGVFRSPFYPPASLLDDRFFPHTISQWLAYPLFWALQKVALVSELPLQDPRLAVALILVTLTIVSWRTLEPVPRALLVFFGIGYATWLMTSSILRYAIMLEVAGGLLAPLLLTRLIKPIVQAKLLPLPGLVLASVVLAFTRYPATMRIPYAAQAMQANTVAIPADTLLVLTFRSPVSYLVPLLSRQGGLQVINVGDTVLEARGWRLHDDMVRMIHDHAGPIRVLTAGNPIYEFPELAEIGLSPKLEQCQAIDSNFAAAGAATAQLCVGRKEEPRTLTDPFWAQASAQYRTLVQVDDGSQRMIGAAYLKAAGPAARGTRLVDWTDLLWSGVGSDHRTIPGHFDAGSLYILPQSSAPIVADRLDPERDLLTQIDGYLVLAPGWLDRVAGVRPKTPCPPPDSNRHACYGLGF